MKSLIVIVALIMAITGAKAQSKISEGKIVYTITMADNDIDPQVAAMMPREMTLTFKGNKSKADMDMGMIVMKAIYDDKSKIFTMLMDMMGQKMSFKMNADSMEKMEGKRPKMTIKYLDETKVICGYTCHKAEITVEGEKEKQIIYYTKDIVAKNANAIKGGLKELDGFPMEYQVYEKGLKMKFIVKSVSADQVNDLVFNIPPDYKELSKVDLQKMGGGH